MAKATESSNDGEDTKTVLKDYKISSKQKQESIRLLMDLLSIAVYIGNELLECMYRVSKGEYVYMENLDNAQVKKKLRHLFKALNVPQGPDKKFSIERTSDYFFVIFRKLLHQAAKQLDIKWADLRAAKIPEEKPLDPNQTLAEIYRTNYSSSGHPISYLPNSSDLWGLTAAEQKAKQRRLESAKCDPWTRFDHQRDLAVAPKSLPAALINSMYGNDNKLDSRFNAPKKQKGASLFPPKPPSADTTE